MKADARDPDVADLMEVASTDEAPSRYVVGIDLGTTNSAVAYVDTSDESATPNESWKIKNFPVRQLVAAGQVEARDSLPSFHYEPAKNEFGDGNEALQLPWAKQRAQQKKQKAAVNHIVGTLARDHGAEAPSRLIASAKSWLCHTGVDRTQDLLPWHGAEDTTRLSPVEASARFLKHIRRAWDASFPDEKLADQDIVLTLPASFDEVARELTVEAAARAGLKRVVLIEEPQAAFYHWIDSHRDTWQEHVQPRQKILVCDVGGGTSDFTLILVRQNSDDPQGEVQFHRVAVGDHLILGGDNLDLALAQHLESRLAGDGNKLPPRRWDALWRQCRQVKETMLGASAPETMSVSLSGGGSKLIGGAMQCEVTREEVESLLLDGFFPATTLSERPQRQASGFQEFGLPYATDPAVTKYLAEFLHRHQETGVDWDRTQGASATARPDIVLFNGGVFSSPAIQQRVIDCLRHWFPDEQSGEERGEGDEQSEGWSPVILENPRLDLAVARGAAYFGMVRRGQGVKINSGLARTYYIGVEGDEPAAMCLVPAGAEPGEDIELEGHDFRLQVATPVEFPLYVSSTRLTDLPGQLVPIDPEQLRPLAPIRTVLKTRGRDHHELAVQLATRITEIGTLELWCHETAGDRQWRLQFDVRAATETDVAEHQGAAEQFGFLDESLWTPCEAVLESVFGEEPTDKPSKLVKQLEETLGESRGKWAPSLLRRIWEKLLELESGRRRSPAHEARWLNFVGFSLRPGYGLAVDDWRVAETWRIVQGKLAHGSPDCRTEAWILWRRIAGGLRATQQQALADPLLGMVRKLHKRIKNPQAKQAGIDLTSHEAAEIWRLLGSLEHLPLGAKIELGDIMCDIIPKRKLAPIRSGVIWALARIGARQPVYGLLNDVAPREKAEQWIETLVDFQDDEQTLPFALMQLARKTEDRYRDIDAALRERVLDRLKDLNASQSILQIVSDGGALDDEQQQQVFGDSLPHGLRLS